MTAHGAGEFYTPIGGKACIAACKKNNGCIMSKCRERFKCKQSINRFWYRVIGMKLEDLSGYLKKKREEEGLPESEIMAFAVVKQAGRK